MPKPTDSSPEKNADGEKRTEPPETAAETASPEKPPYLPEKFWDKAQARPRLEDMAQSYIALERRLSQAVIPPDDNASEEEIAAFHRQLGVPEKAEDYRIEIDGKDIEIEDDIRATLHREGFTQKQVNTMYHLAQNHLMPMVSEMTEEIQSQRDIERLKEHFGGPQRWEHASSQIRTWAKSHLPSEIFDLLSTHYEGVLALEAMMHSPEPKLLSRTDEPAAGGEAYLRKLIASPAYWKNRDPETIRKVTEGFARLYPDT